MTTHLDHHTASPARAMVPESCQRRRAVHRWQSSSRILNGVLAATVLCMIASGAATEEWYSLNPLPHAVGPPNSGSYSAVAFVDDGIGMVVGRDGAVLRTEDGGMTWSVKGDHHGHLCGGRFDDIAMLTGDTAVVVGFFGSISCDVPEPNFIWRTTNGGTSWVPAFQADDVIIRAISFADGNIGLAVGNSVGGSGELIVLRTSDGGITWTRLDVESPISAGLWTTVSLLDPATAIVGGIGIGAGGTIGGAILRTADGGETWDLQLHDPDFLYVDGIAIIEGERGIAVGGEVGIVLITSDGGVSWTRQETGADGYLNAVACSDSGNCIAVGGVESFGGPVDGRIILRSSDGGFTWTAMMLEEGTSTLHGVAFRDEMTVVTVGYQTTFNSTNGDGAAALLRSTDGGVTWVSQTSGVTAQQLKAVSFSDAHTGTVVGLEGTILRTEDGGDSWEIQASGTELGLMGVAFVDSMKGVVVGRNFAGGVAPEGVILRTADGGATWQAESAICRGDIQASCWLESVSCPDEERCFAVGVWAEVGTAVCGTGSNTWAIVLRTDDGGDTWETSLADPAMGLPSHCSSGQATRPRRIDISCGDVNRCIVVSGRAGDANAYIWRTTDGGDNWDRTDTQPAGVLRSVHMVDGNRAFAIGRPVEGSDTGNVMLQTSDGGGSWLPQSLPETQVQRRIFADIGFADQHVGMAVGNNTVYRTTDGGDTWTPEETGEAVRRWLQGVALPDAETAIVVGPDGTILTTTGQPGAGELSLTPDPLDFGEVPVGESSDATSLTLTSTGTDPVTVSEVSDPDVPFASAGGTCGAPPFSLAPDESCTLDYTFSPTVAGPAESTVAVVSDAPSSPDVVGLTGVGVEEGELPIADITPESFEFEAPAGGSEAQILTVGNIGTADLVWSIEEAEAGATGMGAMDVGVGMPHTYGLTGGVDFHTPVGHDRAAGLISSVNRVPADPIVLPTPQLGPFGEFDEGFDDIALLPGAGWALINNSEPLGPSSWFQGNPTIFLSHEGDPDSYIAVNFESTSGAGDISNWLLTPEVTIENGTELKFWTRTSDQFEEFYDRLEVRLSVAGDSIDVGDTAESVGDFTTLLLTINEDLEPGEYPEEWTEFVVEVRDRSREPVTGRFAFRYWVTDSGPDGTNGDYIGIDTVGVRQPGTVPPVGCDNPVDIPWLSTAPDAGTTPPGESVPVDVTVDTAGLDEGDHDALLCVTTNDPNASLVEIPVHLTVTGGATATF